MEYAGDLDPYRVEIMSDITESRVIQGETPVERKVRQDRDNRVYKGRASKGWKHPKDRRGKNSRVFDKFKKGPFHGGLRDALKRDVGLVIHMKESLLGFKEWLRSQDNA